MLRKQAASWRSALLIQQAITAPLVVHQRYTVHHASSLLPLHCCWQPVVPHHYGTSDPVGRFVQVAAQELGVASLPGSLEPEDADKVHLL